MKMSLEIEISAFLGQISYFLPKGNLKNLILNNIYIGMILTFFTYASFFSRMLAVLIP
jgi:hypothetical protein